MCRVIGISGTPGVGKTYVARRISEIINGLYIDLSKEVVDKKLYNSYDMERGSYVADPDKINDFIRELCEKNPDKIIVVDSHYPEIIDPSYIEKIFVLRANPEKIAERLCEREWPREKIIENIEAEILGVCLYNAVEEQDPFKICEIYEKDLEQAVEKILRILRGEDECRIMYIDWISVLETSTPEEIYEKICVRRDISRQS